MRLDEIMVSETERTEKEKKLKSALEKEANKKVRAGVKAEWAEKDKKKKEQDRKK